MNTREQRTSRRSIGFTRAFCISAWTGRVGGRRTGRAAALAIAAIAGLIVSSLSVAGAPAAGASVASGSAARASAARASAAAAADANSNLLLKYDLNEGTGTTADDSSGNGWNGTLMGGASWTQAGDNYGGVALDGSSGYINLPDGPLQNLHDVTMSINVKMNSNTGNDWLGILGYSPSQYFGMDADAGTLNSYYTNQGNTYEVSTAAPAVGQWTNVTLVISSTDETMSIYINGTLENTTTGLTGDVSTLYSASETTSGGYVGKSVWGGDPYLNATVDDFRVYNAALTGDQIAAIAGNAPVSPATATPVTVSTTPGTYPSLPSSVSVPMTDGTNQVLPVQWAAIASSSYANPGTFTVQGTTTTTPSLDATATVYVLPQPTLTSSAQTQTSVTLNWSAETDAASYTLSRSTTSGSGYQQIYSGTGTSFTDTGLTLATIYYYVLSYTTTGGGTSVNSPELAVTTDTKLVGPPTVTQSSYLQPYEVDLSWTSVPLADSYNIYRSDTADGTYTLLANVTGTAYDDTTVDQDSTYYYEVSCVNAAGEGPRSAPLQAQTAVDTVPPTTLTSPAQTDSTITLNWVPVSGATSYSLYRTTTSGSAYALVYSGDAASYTDTDLVTGTTYYYVVTYTDDLGTSVNSRELKVSTVAVTVPAPSQISVENSYANAIQLHWNSVVGADSFNLYRSGSPDGTYTLVTNTTGDTYTDTGLTAGTTYYYELSSVNAAGESSRSAPFQAATDSGTSTIITNKTTWYDVDGNPINAGSGDIIQVGDTYYWYGSSSSGPFDVNVYSSTDLVHWKFVNQILTTNTTLGMNGQPAADLQASTGDHLERIKVIYDAATQQYVLWAHYDNSDYSLAEVGTAFSSTPAGDFTWDHAFHPAGLDSRDETVFVDTDGTGYLISATGGFDGPDTDVNSHVTLFQMTPDDLGIAEDMYNIYGGANDSGLYAGREAPALVENDGYYYLVTSEASGWYPSPAMYSVVQAGSLADTTAASWTGNTNIDAAGGWDGGGEAYYLGNRNDFGGQSVYILPVTGTHGTSFLYMNDTLDPQASGVSGPMWLPLQLHDGVATLNYSQQVSIDAKTGEISNIYPGSLLSQGKPATASSYATTDSDGNVNPDGWTAGYANDGDYNTEWIAANNTYPAWWEVDLGQESVINDVQLSWWMIGGSEAEEDFDIQVSDDGINWTNAYDLTSGDTQYGFNDCPIPSVEGRYVRVYIVSSHTQNNGGTWYTPQIYEARVYGTAAPNSATVTTPDSNGNYTLQVPSNIDNYPATGTFTLNLGPVSVEYPTSDLLSNLGHGTLTAGNDKVPSATLSTISGLAGSRAKTVDAFGLSLISADGTTVSSLGSPASVTVNLTPAEVTTLSGKGTPTVFYYDPTTKSLTKVSASFDLAHGTVTYDAGQLGTYAVELTNIPARLTVNPKPVIKGTAAVGQSLTATAGSYSVAGVTVTYQWLRNGTAIKGATSASYKLTAADRNAKLSARVTASKSGYTTTSTVTAKKGPVR